MWFISITCLHTVEIIIWTRSNIWRTMTSLIRQHFEFWEFLLILLKLSGIWKQWKWLRLWQGWTMTRGCGADKDLWYDRVCRTSTTYKIKRKPMTTQQSKHFVFIHHLKLWAMVLFADTTLFNKVFLLSCNIVFKNIHFENSEKCLQIFIS